MHSVRVYLRMCDAYDLEVILRGAEVLAAALVRARARRLPSLHALPHRLRVLLDALLHVLFGRASARPLPLAILRIAVLVRESINNEETEINSMHMDVEEVEE